MSAGIGPARASQRSAQDPGRRGARPDGGQPAAGHGQAVGGQGEQEQRQHGEQRGGDEVDGDVEGEDVHPEHVEHAEADVRDGAVEVPGQPGRPRRCAVARRASPAAGEGYAKAGERGQAEGGAEQGVQPEVELRVELGVLVVQPCLDEDHDGDADGGPAGHGVSRTASMRTWISAACSPGAGSKVR